MKEKLTAVKFYHTNKENQPLLDRNQRPYTRVNIQTEQHQKTWMSGLAYQGDPQLSWKVSDEVEIETSQNGQYTNFNIPKAPKSQGAMSPEIVEKLFAKLDRIEQKIDNLESVEPSEDDIAMQGPPLDEPEIPF